MFQSKLFTKTRKEAPKDEQAKNAQLLIRAGYIHKNMAGVYEFLPLGLRVMNKISAIIREEMDAIGAQELKMTVLQDKGVWEKTGRWPDEAMDIWMKSQLKSGGEVGLAATHEEPLTKLLKNYISSYKDLPLGLYQIQVKFRNELRAKSGILRGREFLMKDLYSFARSEKEHEEFYDFMKGVYKKIFERVGIGEQTYITVASGGAFTENFTHEFQTLTEAGEDIIYLDEKKGMAINKEVYTDENIEKLGLDKEKLVERKSIEVGNIFPLGTRFSDALGLKFKDEGGVEQPVVMGSYGIGISRLMGAVVEVLADERGLVWPEAIAPFKVHLISLGKNEEAKKIYKELEEKGIEVLYDDRDISAGEKFSDSDLIGIVNRVVVSEKTLQEGSVELKKRNSADTELVIIDQLPSRL
ncbi:MAG: aminoacyl--tRNA ligase-related protein [Candidatus Harrisonbacteria bacterium]|nr:aminoacyl--tRNA ligase-related protein [Candidatus Harrisonbacteria bacterium]